MGFDHLSGTVSFRKVHLVAEPLSRNKLKTESLLRQASEFGCVAQNKSSNLGHRFSDLI